MCHSAHVTGFHFVLPGFVQVQPGVYGAGSRPHLIPTARNSQGRTFGLFPSAGEPEGGLEIFITCLKQLGGSFSVIYLKGDNIFILQPQKLKLICSACPKYILLKSHTQTQAYFTSKTHTKPKKNLLSKYNMSQ